MPNTYDRRTFLTHSAATVGGVAMAGTVVDTMLSGIAGATTGVGTGTPTTTGTINVGLESDAPNSSQFTGATGKLDAAGFCVANAVYDTLFLTPKNGQLPLLPNLALSYADTSSGGNYTQWTIQIRHGVTFHDGSTFDGNTVVANVAAQQLNPTVGSAIQPFVHNCVLGSNNYEVIYNLKIPFFNFPYILAESQIAYMALPSMFAYSGYVGVTPNYTYKGAPIGTGPFKYKSWSVGTESQWVRNGSYWRKDASGKALPYLAEINFKTIPEPSQRLTALKSGSIDVGIFSDGTSVKSIEAGASTKNGKALYISTLNQSIIQPAMNCIMCNVTAAGYQKVNKSGTWVPGKASPISDVRIRTALAYAINASGYNQKLDQGVGGASNGIFTTNSPYYKNPGYPTYSTANLSKAKTLVAAYKTANSIAKSATVNITMQTLNTTLAAAQFAYIAKDAAAVGIKLTPVPMLQSVLIGNAISRGYEMTQWSQFGGIVMDGNYVWWDSSKTTTGNAPGFFGGAAYAGGVNFANNIDPIIETAMLSALAANSNAAQKVQWQTVNDRFAIDIPYLWLDVTFAVWAAQPKVQNWANAHAPTTGDVKSVTSVISPDGGDLEWAEIWV